MIIIVRKPDLKSIPPALVYYHKKPNIYYLDIINYYTQIIKCEINEYETSSYTDIITIIENRVPTIEIGDIIEFPDNKFYFYNYPIIQIDI